MAHTKHQLVLEALARLDFKDKGESFVEQKFVTPLLEYLGYETHKDYEAIRHLVGRCHEAFKKAVARLAGSHDIRYGHWTTCALHLNFDDKGLRRPVR